MSLEIRRNRGEADQAGEAVQVGEAPPAGQAVQSREAAQPGQSSWTRTPTHPPKRSRHIPQATREAVLLSDDERYTFVGVDGRRCTAVHEIQIDHVQPYALGGTLDLENLRVLCGAHNRWRAEKEFGPRPLPS